MADDFYDREYNPRLSVTNIGEYFERWQAGAKDARETASARWDLKYGASDEETLDFHPAEGDATPLLIFIHGGYWRALHKDDFAWIAMPFVEAGISVANINYALAPQVSLGDIVAQIRRSVAWLHHNVGDLGFDPERVVCCGHSAGGHLAAMLLTTDWSTVGGTVPANPLRGVVAISGLFDLEPLMRASFLKEEIVLSPQEIHDLSPARLKPSGRTPALTMVGELESKEFHRQNELLADSWGRSLVTGPLVIENANHFDVCEVLVDSSSEPFKRTVEMCAGV